MKLINYFLAASFILPASGLFASEKTDKRWSQQLASEGLIAKDQAYCYTNELGKVEGVNIDMRIRLASVSKLLVTLWSVERLGIHFKYDTKLFIKGKNLHIAGSFDPFLGNEKMFFLLSQLNELGFDHFDQITFDRSLLVNPNAQYAADEYPVMNATTNARNLKSYFNTDSWSADMKEEYQNFFALAKAGRFKKDLKFSAGDIKMVESNPFLNDEEAKTYTLSSPELSKYLKEMNVKSNNYVAETIFRQLGGTTKFEQFLSERFNLGSDKIHFYSGSGLPTIIDGQRKDNYASCSVMLDLINELKKAVEKQAGDIKDVVAVPGSDKGTFRNRLFPADFKNAFVAKTGTLMHTSTLAGAMSTKKGFSFFGVFNQSTDIVGSKKVQNSMVESIMNEMGGPLNFEYEVDGFHTYGPETLKILDLVEGDFTSIDKGLF